MGMVRWPDERLPTAGDGAMYNPDPFRIEDPAVLRDFIARHPLGALVALVDTEFVANHIPMIWRPTAGTHGALRGHIARANPLWRRLPSKTPVIVIFQGAEHYISPRLYPGGSLAEGKILPTWNYCVVHAHGHICFHDSSSEALNNVTALAEHFEGKHSQPWRVGDAPTSYVTALLERIVPFEISLSGMTGKFKASQQRPAEERNFVAQCLLAEGVPPAEVAELLQSKG